MQTIVDTIAERPEFIAVFIMSVIGGIAYFVTELIWRPIGRKVDFEREQWWDNRDDAMRKIDLLMARYDKHRKILAPKLKREDFAWKANNAMTFNMSPAERQLNYCELTELLDSLLPEKVRYE